MFAKLVLTCFYLLKSDPLQIADDCIGCQGIELEIEFSARVEALDGIVANALVEDDGIVFSGKKRYLWLIVEHVFVHSIAF